MEGMIKQKLSDRPINIIECLLSVESGSKPEEGEYGLSITGFTGSLDIYSLNQNDDIDAIKECIQEDFDFTNINGESFFNLVLKESGEWEGEFWHKFYIIDRVCKL